MNKFIGEKIYPLVIVAFLCGLFVTLSFAQDPGLPDSVIITGDSLIPYNPVSGATFDARIYCVTDDSILFTGIPVRWSGSSVQIFPTQVTWFNTFSGWAAYYDMSEILNNRIFLGAFCPYQESLPLFTYYQRELEITIRFSILPSALPQIIIIESARYSFPGVFEFANIEVSFVPKIKRLQFRYGIPGQSIDHETSVPKNHTLIANYPNPFNGQTKIELNVANRGYCRLNIYDISGREIALLINGDIGQGRYLIIWDGRDKSGHDCATGIYLLQMVANGFTETRKITILR